MNNANRRKSHVRVRHVYHFHQSASFAFLVQTKTYAVALEAALVSNFESDV
jgi:hypothetical protein